ncbi:MAG: His/Gly/Thr/Pro-type tRNA ligase C-terminal domain-containing protein, partial [Thermoanaerobaculia bacterium]|nr:His/Gly/Thr/Pro-type tRNA ligase C-terminal domain-containing protein [Thermoanaerobaculia bacterium]
PEGFSGPLGVENLRIFADVTLRSMRNVTVGANRADIHLRNVNLGRDFTPTGFGDFTVVGEGDPCPRCRTELEMFRGIEVGHIFKLGTKYSTAMSCEFLDEDGERHPMIMGCYGLGIGRTVAAAVEQGHDDDGIIWPVSIAPFEVLVTPIGRDDEVHETAEKIYSELREKDIDALLDDRDERPGVKFKDADLLGIPLRITVGKKSLAEGNVEFSTRRDREKKLVSTEDATGMVIQAIDSAKSIP